jgi:hypothetical protein
MASIALSFLELYLREQAAGERYSTSTASASSPGSDLRTSRLDRW